MIKDIASPAAYGAAGGTVFLGMSVDEWGITGVVIGIIFAVATYATNFYFRRKHLELARKK